MTSDLSGSNQQFESNQTRGVGTKGVGTKCVGTKELLRNDEMEQTKNSYLSIAPVGFQKINAWNNQCLTMLNSC